MAQIIIVEDEANVRKFARVNLLARGHQVVEAENAAEGIALLRSGGPALLLLDIKLPDMSGWDLLRAILDDPHLPKITVVVITASLAEPPVDLHYPNLYKVLIKPVAARDLVNVVEEVLSGGYSDETKLSGLGC